MVLVKRVNYKIDRRKHTRIRDFPEYLTIIGRFQKWFGGGRDKPTQYMYCIVLSSGGQYYGK